MLYTKEARHKINKDNPGWAQRSAGFCKQNEQSSIEIQPLSRHCLSLTSDLPKPFAFA